MEATALLTAALITIAALAAFTDFLIGPKHQRHLKDRLVEWYVAAAGDGWGDLVRAAASKTDDAVSAILGRRIVSWRAIVVSVVFGLIASSLTILIYATVQFLFRGAGWTSTPDDDVMAAVSIVLANTLIDTPALMASRAILRALTRNTSGFLTVLLLAAHFLVAFLAISLAVTLTTPIAATWIFFGDGSAAEMIENFLGLLSLGLWEFVSRPFHIERHGLAVIAYPAALTAVIHLIVIGTAWLARMSRPLTQKPLLLVLERLESAPSGTLSMVAGFAAGVAGLIAAYS